MSQRYPTLFDSLRIYVAVDTKRLSQTGHRRVPVLFSSSLHLSADRQFSSRKLLKVTIIPDFPNRSPFVRFATKSTLTRAYKQKTRTTPEVASIALIFFFVRNQRPKFGGLSDDDAPKTTRFVVIETLGGSRKRIM